MQDYFHCAFLPDFGNTGVLGNWMGLAMFAGICLYIYWDACRAKITPSS
jgi:hypothetical protein